MSPADVEMLRGAIARNAGAVLSLPSAGMLRHNRTRLLLAQDEGFWVEAAPGEQSLIAEIIAGEKAIGLSLKSGVHKVVFTSQALQFQAGMQVNKDLAVDALLVAWPGEIKSIQRRAVYRVKVPGECDTSINLWRIAEHHYLPERPQAATRVQATLHDLGVGGAGVRCTLKADAPKPAIDQRLRVQIIYAGGELIIEGRVRYLRPLPSGEVLMGVQFKKLEDGGIQGRQAMATLTNIVGQLHRAEIRRHRLATPTPKVA